jgi:2-iminoacetate synthase ThiH
MNPVVSTAAPYYAPDLATLKTLSAGAEASVAASKAILQGVSNGQPLQMEDLAVLLNTLLSPDAGLIIPEITATSARFRADLFQNWVVPMAPIEVSNTCASDCLFCGWRVSNRAMKRLKMPADLAMMQVEYLVDMGIHYIEFVSGDDISVVRDLLPDLIRETRALFDRHGIKGKISFCTLALTEAQYADLKAAGADNMIVWQETYDPDIFQSHIKGGPKAFGISDGWKVDRSGDGCLFRIQSQERALRAGLEVALGSMLGLNPDVTTEFLATVDHARYLMENYDISPEHPIIIGMPIWNAITTRETDLRPAERMDMNQVFPALAALYLLALPDRATWVFPNCRVPLPIQIQAAKVAGAFSSTEVKLGPGGYLPDVILRKRSRGEDTGGLEERIYGMLKESGNDIDHLRRLLDEREQFMHHYHAHESYCAAMESEGLRLTDGVQVPAPPEGRS